MLRYDNPSRACGSQSRLLSGVALRFRVAIRLAVICAVRHRWAQPSLVGVGSYADVLLDKQAFAGDESCSGV